jgi:hypothetical protein
VINNYLELLLNAGCLGLNAAEKHVVAPGKVILEMFENRKTLS